MSKEIYIYDINDYEMINNIYINYSVVNKYNETSIILLRNLHCYQGNCNKEIVLISLPDIKDIKYENFDMDFIIIFQKHTIYICLFMKPFDFKPIKDLKNKYTKITYFLLNY